MEMTYVKVFQDWTKQTENLKDAEKGRLIDAMVLYAATGEDVTERLSGNERILFPVYQAQIDRDRRALADYSKQQSENGSKGGRPPKKPKNPPFSDEKPKNPPLFPESEKSYNNNKDYNYIPPPTPSEGETPCGGGGAAYVENNLRGMSPNNWEELRSYLTDGLTMDVICHAVDEAAANGKRTWAYVRTILNRYLTSGITTVEQAKASDGKPKEQPQKDERRKREEARTLARLRGEMPA